MLAPSRRNCVVVWRFTTEHVSQRKVRLKSRIGSVRPSSAQMRFAVSETGSAARIAECDPFCALQACLKGVQVVAISEIDTFSSSTGNFNIPSQVMIVGKRASVCKYCKDCASALSGSGARMLFAQSDLFHALQACFESGL